jgi:hypothetical protein
MLPNQSICINIYIFRDVAFSAGGATCSLSRLYLSECVCFSLVVTEKRNKAEKRVFTVQKKSSRLFTARGVKCGSQGVSRAPLHSCAAMSCSRFAASGRRMQNKVTLDAANHHLPRPLHPLFSARSRSHPEMER